QVQVDNTKLPADERYTRAFSGRYWAFIDLDANNKVLGFMRSESLFDEDAVVAPEVRAAAVMQPGTVLHLDAPGPDDKQIRLGLQAVTFADRPQPMLLYAAIDRTIADESVGNFTLRLGVALGVLALG